MMTPILEARGLMKRYGQTQALAGLDLVACPGRVVALLGPNGAGKTTFVRAVATLLRPDAGTLHVDGIDALRKPAKVRQVIGLAGQFAAVEKAMTGRENLEMVGRLFGLSRRQAKAAAVRVLEQMQLTDDADRLVRTYSGGMRRRIDLGVILVGTPPPAAARRAIGRPGSSPSCASAGAELIFSHPNRAHMSVKNATEIDREITMGARLDYRGTTIAANFGKYLNSAGKAVTDSSLPAATQALVKIRASQINGCAPCTDAHTKDAEHAGETSVRLNLIAVWREATVFTDASGGVTDQAWANAAKHYDGDQLAALVSLVAVINAYNRINVILQRPGGDYQPGQRG
jgi:AhpD family alkylhydroperoxidase